ncbi:hypothetical protein H2199_001157 [Coniosporium tulheliwenetii]|uniref:Uncharacterized protein n=1 Tax=Coniosporium tulheliwenetii TaxID=3383036 RepID=A0ACC2ZL76_9PEZI|nr:hypothetical protein H2199_001157 [Cladosporium sp. JES 115]
METAHRYSGFLREVIRINYIDCPPPPSTASRGIILLIHGFPQTSYQFRHVVTPLANAGYRIIAPDYRGAGQSSRPASGYTKTVMASDLIALMSHLETTSKIHIVGHDIGGMVAHAYASRQLSNVASIVWGECPLPGTSAYAADRTTHQVAQFHFIFHSVPDLPEALVAGREGVYLKHFFDKLVYNSAAITDADFGHYVLAYSQPGAMRAAFQVYSAFEKDAEENKEWVKREGKCKVPCMVFSGEMSRHKEEAENMAREVYEDVEAAVVEASGHYLAEENPEGFVKQVLEFIGKHCEG